MKNTVRAIVVLALLSTQIATLSAQSVWNKIDFTQGYDVDEGLPGADGLLAWDHSWEYPAHPNLPDGLKLTVRWLDDFNTPIANPDYNDNGDIVITIPKATGTTKSVTYVFEFSNPVLINAKFKGKGLYELQKATIQTDSYWGFHTEKFISKGTDGQAIFVADNIAGPTPRRIREYIGTELSGNPKGDRVNIRSHSYANKFSITVSNNNLNKSIRLPLEIKVRPPNPPAPVLAE